MKTLIRWGSLGLCLLTLQLRANNAPPTHMRLPNVLVIVVDDLGWADLSCHGSEDIRTPHIDRLAASGIRFSAGYVTASVCGPSRAAIITGQYHERLGISGNKNADVGLPLSATTAGDVMQGLGYHTIAIGKWHLGLSREFHPLNRGFDEFFGFQEGGMNYLPFARGPVAPGDPELLDDFEPVTLPADRYLTDEFAEQAVRRIAAQGERPWFLYLAFNAPHAPLVATPAYEARNSHIKDPKRRTYAGMMTALDDGVGRVMAELDRLGLSDDTLVFFLSDNGGPTAKTTSRNDPFRGVKGDITEGGIRVPFFMRWPGRLEAGRQVDHPVQSLDILPTMVAATGGDLTDYPQFEGENLLPLLSGDDESAPHDWMYFNRHGRQALRDQRYKLIVGGPTDTLGLYDLLKNPEEDADLRLDDTPRIKNMRSRFDAWWRVVESDRNQLQRSAPSEGLPESGLSSEER